MDGVLTVLEELFLSGAAYRKNTPTLSTDTGLICSHPQTRTSSWCSFSTWVCLQKSRMTRTQYHTQLSPAVLLLDCDYFYSESPWPYSTALPVPQLLSGFKLKGDLHSRQHLQPLAHTVRVISSCTVYIRDSVCTAAVWQSHSETDKK